MKMEVAADVSPLILNFGARENIRAELTSAATEWALEFFAGRREQGGEVTERPANAFLPIFTGFQAKP